MVDDVTTWWEVTDFLFGRGNVRMSSIAQRQAVPSMPDVVRVLNSEAMREQWSRSETDAVRLTTGETILAAMTRVINAAFRDLPVFCGTTRLDVGDYRYLSIDLMDVAKRGGAGEVKQSTLFYLFALHLLTKRMLVSEESAAEINQSCPEMYHSYHLQVGRKNDQMMRAIDVDELHRTDGNPMVRSFLKLLGREGRKFYLQVSLASQLDTDFDAEMVEIASTVCVMRVPDDAVAQRRLMERFGFSDAAMETARHVCKGPTPGRGVSFLAQYKTKYGNVEQVLTSTVGPLQMWAFSTTAEDMAMRRLVAERLGGDMRAARQALARRFPSGSCKGHIEFMRSRLSGRAASEGDLYEAVADDVVRLSLGQPVKRAA